MPILGSSMPLGALTRAPCWYNSRLVTANSADLRISCAVMVPNWILVMRFGAETLSTVTFFIFTVLLLAVWRLLNTKSGLLTWNQSWQIRKGVVSAHSKGNDCQWSTGFALSVWIVTSGGPSLIVVWWSGTTDLVLRWFQGLGMPEWCNGQLHNLTVDPDKNVWYFSGRMSAENAYNAEMWFIFVKKSGKKEITVILTNLYPVSLQSACCAFKRCFAWKIPTILCLNF